MRFGVFELSHAANASGLSDLFLDRIHAKNPMQSIRIVARRLAVGDEYVSPPSGLLPNLNE